MDYITKREIKKIAEALEESGWRYEALDSVAINLIHTIAHASIPTEHGWCLLPGISWLEEEELEKELNKALGF